jgi:hypothetical protein
MLLTKLKVTAYHYLSEYTCYGLRTAMGSNVSNQQTSVVPIQVDGAKHMSKYLPQAQRRIGHRLDIDILALSDYRPTAC